MAARIKKFNLRRRRENLPKIDIRKDESIDKALLKFKRKVRKEGIIDEMKKREFYEKPSQRRRKNLERARRRERRRRAMQER